MTKRPCIQLSEEEETLSRYSQWPSLAPILKYFDGEPPVRLSDMDWTPRRHSPVNARRDPSPVETNAGSRRTGITLIIKVFSHSSFKYEWLWNTQYHPGSRNVMHDGTVFFTKHRKWGTFKYNKQTWWILLVTGQARRLNMVSSSWPFCIHFIISRNQHIHDRPGSYATLSRPLLKIRDI